MTQYYDLVLGLIPLTLAGFTSVLTLLGFELTLAVTVGAALACALIGHALFVRAPTDAPTDAPTVSGGADAGYQSGD